MHHQVENHVLQRYSKGLIQSMELALNLMMLRTSMEIQAYTSGDVARVGSLRDWYDRLVLQDGSMANCDVA